MILSEIQNLIDDCDGTELETKITLAAIRDKIIIELAKDD